MTKPDPLTTLARVTVDTQSDPTAYIVRGYNQLDHEISACRFDLRSDDYACSNAYDYAARLKSHIYFDNPENSND